MKLQDLINQYQSKINYFDGMMEADAHLMVEGKNSMIKRNAEKSFKFNCDKKLTYISFLNDVKNLEL